MKFTEAQVEIVSVVEASANLFTYKWCMFCTKHRCFRLKGHMRFQFEQFYYTTTKIEIQVLKNEETWHLSQCLTVERAQMQSPFRLNKKSIYTSL